MEGEHTHEAQVPVIQPVIDTGEKELVDPVIHLTERTTRIEEQQARHQEDLLRSITELEGRLSSASASQVQGIEERIARLEAKLEEETNVPEESVELALPEVERSPEPPEKRRQGLRHRRKGKRK